MNKAANRYLREVRSLLPVARKAKTEQTAGLRASLEAYISENPDADYSAIVDNFGTPENFAAACVENTSPEELLKKLRVRKRIITIVLAVALAVLVSWGAVIAWRIHDAKLNDNGYYEKYIVNDKTGEVISHEIIEKLN